jgi:glucose-6-phosphate-specific signal transduction histidine kinase
MNHDFERSSNVLIDDTPSATLLELCANPCGRVEELRGRPTSLTKRLLGRLWRSVRGAIDKNGVVRSRSVAPTKLEHAFFEIWEETPRAGRPPFVVVVTGQPRILSTATEEQVERIQREALVNAIRHSDATTIEAELEYLPRRLRLVIRDNGCGFEPKGLKLGPGPYRGIRSMVAQAKAMGAQLQIWSKPGSGTEVELSLPFDPQAMPALNS